MLFNFVRVTQNRKTGPIPVTYTSDDTCPPACQFRGNGCYAEHGPTLFAWRSVRLSFDDLLDRIRELPKRTLWRHNIAGDLPGVGNRIYPAQLNQLGAAAMHTRGFTYTHKPLTDANRRILSQHRDAQMVSRRNAPGRGLTINISTDNISMADSAIDAGAGPVVTVLPMDAPPITHTPKGRKVIACPAETKKVTCQDCQWCAWTNRDFVVGFRAHGSRKKQVDLIARQAA